MFSRQFNKEKEKYTMKKLVSLLLTGVLALGLLAGCGASGNGKDLAGTTLKIGASPAPDRKSVV